MTSRLWAQASSERHAPSNAAGATGWIAGLVNALPAESVALFDYAMQGQSRDASELYRWFLPLLRFDTVPKFIQLIKLVQEELREGNGACVRRVFRWSAGS